jgi:hypothetical protein
MSTASRSRTPHAILLLQAPKEENTKWTGHFERKQGRNLLLPQMEGRIKDERDAMAVKVAPFSTALFMLALVTSRAASSSCVVECE